MHENIIRRGVLLFGSGCRECRCLETCKLHVFSSIFSCIFLVRFLKHPLSIRFLPLPTVAIFVLRSPTPMASAPMQLAHHPPHDNIVSTLPSAPGAGNGLQANSLLRVCLLSCLPPLQIGSMRAHLIQDPQTKGACTTGNLFSGTTYLELVLAVKRYFV